VREPENRSICELRSGEIISFLDKSTSIYHEIW